MKLALDERRIEKPIPALPDRRAEPPRRTHAARIFATRHRGSECIADSTQALTREGQPSRFALGPQHARGSRRAAARPERIPKRHQIVRLTPLRSAPALERRSTPDEVSDVALHGPPALEWMHAVTLGFDFHERVTELVTRERRARHRFVRVVSLGLDECERARGMTAAIPLDDDQDDLQVVVVTHERYADVRDPVSGIEKRVRQVRMGGRENHRIVNDGARVADVCREVAPIVGGVPVSVEIDAQRPVAARVVVGNVLHERGRPAFGQPGGFLFE